MKKGLRFDEIGYWSEVKLDIIREYAAAYSRILSAQDSLPFQHVYIDAFAGAGLHRSRKSGELVPGSPLNALRINPPFQEYHLIDIRPEKVNSLRELVGSRENVFIYEGDCNQFLLEKVFPRVRYKEYRRGLCILDPYGLHVDWKIVEAAGQMKTIDMFLNFPVADMNRNVLWHEREKVTPEQVERMTAFWGDESWRKIAYSTTRNLFGFPEKEPNEAVAQAFRERLRSVAGFSNVPEPLPMRNSNNAIVYYLFFASQKGSGEKIAIDIFKKYRDRGGL
jgi:three-Cys-motif partner protein